VSGSGKSGISSVGTFVDERLGILLAPNVCTNNAHGEVHAFYH
jgi:hypothetical protein